VLVTEHYARISLRRLRDRWWNNIKMKLREKGFRMGTPLNCLRIGFSGGLL
jgi:hypothetical protein